MISELRLALRRLIATPLFAAAAVLTLTLAVGAHSLVFGAVRASRAGREYGPRRASSICSARRRCWDADSPSTMPRAARAA